MPSSRRLIASQTLSTAAASVTFSSIPTGYRDLVLRTSIRTSFGVAQNVYITFNSVSSGYSATSLNGAGSSASSFRISSQSSWFTSIYADGASNTSNTFSNGELYIPNYLGSSAKVASAFDVVEENAASNNNIMASALLNSSTAAINSLTATAVGGTTFITGSSFYLYGLLES